MGAWTWAAASRCGTSHARGGGRREDAFACGTQASGRSPLVAVLCDGAGSAPRGRHGAALVARIVSLKARAYGEAGVGALSNALIRSWLAEARLAIGDAAAKRQLAMRDFATTLVCALSDGEETLVAHVGDGAVVVQDAADHQWHVVSWPSHGEYASTTFFITDEPEPRLSLHRRVGRLSALVAFTDGVERLALDFAEQRAHAAFFNGIVGPIVASDARGRDGALCAALARYLDGAAVNARTDDDKTLVVAVHR
jgi:hypothetical protein